MITIENEQQITIKKLKKDGSIAEEYIEFVASQLNENKSVIIPVDSIFGILSQKEEMILNLIPEKEREEVPVRLISSFKQLDEIATIDKLQFDFLHRIWPGEIVVYLHKKDDSGTVPVRIPKNIYIQDIIGKIDHPIYFSCLFKKDHNLLFKKKEVLKKYSKIVDTIIIIDEFCKDHTIPSKIDISKGELEILYEGRVSSEEIKSLYFLGKDDVPI